MRDGSGGGGKAESVQTPLTTCWTRAGQSSMKSLFVRVLFSRRPNLAINSSADKHCDTQRYRIQKSVLITNLLYREVTSETHKVKCWVYWK